MDKNSGEEPSPTTGLLLGLKHVAFFSFFKSPEDIFLKKKSPGIPLFPRMMKALGKVEEGHGICEGV